MLNRDIFWAIIIYMITTLLFIPFAILMYSIFYYKSIKLRGTGYKVCKECFGTGEIEEEYGSYLCPFCNGDGKIDWVQRVIHEE